VINTGAKLNMNSVKQNLKMLAYGFGGVCVAMAGLFIGGAVAQQIGNQNDIHGYPPISYGRNIQISTLNDSEAIVVSKPGVALTNDYLDFFSGSLPLFTIGPGGAISNLTAAAATNSQMALGFQVFSNGASVTAGAQFTNWFTNYLPSGYAAPPFVIISQNLGTNGVLSVTTSNFIITNVNGSSPIVSLVIGAP
jgi:hypothetical protein